MSFFQISTLINLVISFIAGLTVYFNDRRANINKFWFLATCSIGVWSLGLFGVTFSDDFQIAWFWQHVLDIGGILIPSTWLLFILGLIKAEFKHKTLIILSFGVSGALIILSFTDLFKITFTSVHNFKYWIVPGKLYFLFPIVVSAFFTYSFILLVNYYKKTKDKKLKQQIKYVAIAQVISVLSGVTNFFPQLFDIYPFGNFLVSLYVVIISYAILKYGLFNVKIILTEILIISIWLFLLARVILPYSSDNRLVDVVLLFIMIFIGTFLIKSVRKDFHQSEHLLRVSKHLEKTNKKLANTAKKLKMLDKAKNEFLSVAAHQLRTPATAVKGYTSMILEGIFGDCDKEVKDALSKVYKANERMTALIEDLLNTSRIEAGNLKYKFEKIKIQDILEELKNTFVIRAKENNLKFSVKYLKKEYIPEIVADKNKIREVISNIIDNAIKYTPKGSVKIKAERENEFIKITVEDTGRGMTDRTKNNLFEKFIRGQESASDVEGTGLGLFVVKNYVEKHNGTIEAYSEGLDKGSKFVIKLPIKRTKEDDEEL